MCSSDLDEALSKCGVEKSLFGIYNAMSIYSEIESVGDAHTRALFASTGVKADGKSSIKKSYYVDSLLLSNSINTAPLDTIESYIADGSDEILSPISKDEIDRFFSKVRGCGIDIDSLYDRLLDEGLDAFKKSFSDMLESF